MIVLSRADLQILKILQVDGRLSNVELAERIGMAPSPCLRRVKQLEESQVIEKYVAILSRAKIGLGIVAHVELKVPQVANVSMNERFREAVQMEPAVVSCYVTTGKFDFLLKVVARDMDEFSRIAMTRLLKLPGVQDMNSSFVLDAVKDSTALPIS
jgi:Lrp/AsnC family transcriptional regulator, leucine-responsive regulatory protein